MQYRIWLASLTVAVLALFGCSADTKTSAYAGHTSERTSVASNMASGDTTPTISVPSCAEIAPKVTHVSANDTGDIETLNGIVACLPAGKQLWVVVSDDNKGIYQYLSPVPVRLEGVDANFWTTRVPLTNARALAYLVGDESSCGQVLGGVQPGEGGVHTLSADKVPGCVRSYPTA